MKRINKIVAGALCAAILTTGAAFAADNAVTEPLTVKTSGISVNGELLDKASTINTEATVYIPVRALCEKLGMQVEWDNEVERVIISKLPVYITFSVNEDAYTFAKTAAMKLGFMPIMKADRTYVPVSFVTEILGGMFEIAEDGTVEINTEADNLVTVEIIEVKKDEEGIVLSVNDYSRGENVVVNVTDETEILYEDGTVAEADVLSEGMELSVKYADFMTMSIPPITNAVKLVIERAADTVEKNASVVSVDAENKQLTVMYDKTDAQLVLNITEETTVEDKDGNAVDYKTLDEGAELYIENADFMTRSIPPMTNAIKIVVL